MSRAQWAARGAETHSFTAPRAQQFPRLADPTPPEQIEGGTGTEGQGRSLTHRHGDGVHGQSGGEHPFLEQTLPLVITR